MDIKNLMTFMQVAELGSFTKAAEKLGYSQSTISFQIKQLESEFNLQLFERIHHTITLTDQGRDVLKYAHHIDKMTKELMNHMRETQDIRGHVQLAMADSLCDSLLVEGFMDLRKQYPYLTLKIMTAGTEEMFRLVNQNQVDMILTLDSHIYNTEYVIVKEEKVNVHFVTYPDHPLTQFNHVSIQQVLQHPFILTEKGMSYRRLMEEKLAEMSLEVKPVLEIGNTSMICSLLMQGVGVSFLPDYVTEDLMKTGQLAYIHVDDFEVEVWKQLLYHRDKWISPQIETIIQFCIKREFTKKEDRVL